QGDRYPHQKLMHALWALKETGIQLKKDHPAVIALLRQSIRTQEWITHNISESRSKDYTNPYRKMVYDNQAEMDAVTGRLEDNAFIVQETAALKKYKRTVNRIISDFSETNL